MIAAKLIGTITRRCPDCKMHKECVVFTLHGRKGLFCDKCMIKNFGIGVITTKKKISITTEWCTVCESLSMECQDTKVTDTAIKKQFKCKYCGRKVLRRVLKWRR